MKISHQVDFNTNISNSIFPESKKKSQVEKVLSKNWKFVTCLFIFFNLLLTRSSFQTWFRFPRLKKYWSILELTTDFLAHNTIITSKFTVYFLDDDLLQCFLLFFQHSLTHNSVKSWPISKNLFALDRFS